MAHIACICVRALFISAICWVSSRTFPSAFSVFSVFFSNSSLRIYDLLDDVELEVDIIVSLSDSVARELPIITSVKSESTLKLSREGQSSSSKSSKLVYLSDIWGSFLTFKGGSSIGCAALVPSPPFKTKRRRSNFFDRFISDSDSSQRL